MSDAIMNSSILQKMKVPDLKKLLKEKRLSTVGNKAELIARLENGGGIGDAEHANTSHEDDEDLLEDDDEDVMGGDSSELTEELDASLSTSPVVKTSTFIPANTAVKSSTAAATTVAAAVPKPKITKIEVAPAVAKIGGGADKLQDRLKRFGVVSEDVKKNVRAERFQTASAAKVTGSTTGNDAAAAATVTVTTKKNFTPVVLSSTTVVEDQARLKKRSERFGPSVTAAAPAASATATSPTTAGAAPLAKGSDIDTLKKRAERFGALTSTSLAKADEQERVLKRKGRFGTILAPANASSSDGASDAKKMKRAERFGLPAVATTVAI